MKKYLAVFVSVCLVAFACFGLVGCGRKSAPNASYELACEYRPEDNSVTGSLKVTVKNPFAAPLEEIKFFLYPNAYRKGALYPAVGAGMWDEVYYAGASYGEISVSSVHGAVGWEIEGEDENILSASLETPLGEGESVVLDLGFTTRLPCAKHRLGVTERTVNLGWFYPVLCALTEEGFTERVCCAIGDPFESDCAEYSVSFTCPKEYKLAAAGELVSENTLESKKRFEYSLSNAREFTAVLSKDFKVLQETKAGRMVEYYYLSDSAPHKTLETAVDALAYYSSVFGEYAYGRYAITETPLPFLGVEYTAVSLLCEGLSEEERTRAAAHETAHQWWYAAVGSNQFENAWQDEGLAEYSAILFLNGKGECREALVEKSLREYQGYAKTYLSALGWVDRRMNRPLAEYLSGYEYSCVSVHKAVVMFDELRKATGKKRFFAGLKKYYAENKFGRVNAENLVGAFERIGVDTAGFFDGFLNGKDGVV